MHFLLFTKGVHMVKTHLLCFALHLDRMEIRSQCTIVPNTCWPSITVQCSSWTVHHQPLLLTTHCGKQHRQVYTVTVSRSLDKPQLIKYTNKVCSVMVQPEDIQHCLYGVKDTEDTVHRSSMRSPGVTQKLKCWKVEMQRILYSLLTS